ncbi:MAG: patatin-like phospholipase family protein [Deltaproteobacteria bacterium]|nr:patatin-like phospholipase family protein [Deltaproteobacteria bacterium]
MARNRPLVGVALDSGGAMGGAHIGVLQVLAESRIPIDIIVGSSAGAAVGAFYATGKLEAFKELITDLSFIDSLSYYVDPVFPSSGLLAGNRARRFIHDLVGDTLIEDLPIRYIAVATDLLSGETVPIDRGSLTDAVLASISMPVIFRPVVHMGRMLTDGGVSDPLPLDVLKSLSPNITIACNLHAKVPRRFSSAKRQTIIRAEQTAQTGEEEALASWIIEHVTNLLESPKMPDRLKTFAMDLMQKVNSTQTFSQTEIEFIRTLQEQLIQAKDRFLETIGERFPARRESSKLNIFEILSSSMNIQQYQKNRLMLLYDPPDVLIEPDVTDVGSLEFTLGEHTIVEGRKKALAALPEIRKLLREKQRSISPAGGSSS